jgi:murein DD-endopeptidase MepM/ murein hydrolase activator NlpD
MMSPRRAAVLSMLLGALAPVAGVGTASAAPAAPVIPVVSGDLQSAQVQADRLRAEVDTFARNARQAADAADVHEQRYVEVAVLAAAARHDLDERNRNAAELAEVGNDRVRALYMSGGQLGAVNSLLRAEGLGDLSSRQQNVATLVDEDTLRTRQAKAAADEAAAAKAKVDRLVAEQATAAEKATRAVETAAAALRARRDLLRQADTTVAALISARTAEEAEAKAASAARFAALSTASMPVASGEWIRPVVGPLSSPYGQRWGTLHAGIDFAARPGSVIRAASSGTVVLAGWYGGYGNAVDIDHGGIMTRYGHASEVLVSTGEYVTAGQPIALVGSTGDSTGPHLHFEVRVKGTPVDPIPFLEARGVSLR